MTKIFPTLLIILGVYSVTFAQTKNNVEFGANIGYNIASVNETGYGDYNSPAVDGVNLGLSADFKISDSWSIRGKVIYDQKGWNNGYLLENGGTMMNNVNFQLNYLTVPITANWHFGRTRNWYLNFGPYAGLLLNATETPYNTDVKSAFNSNDFGIALGIGVKFPISDKLKLFIEDEEEAGAANILRATSGGTVVQSLRSGINVGINFPLD